MDANGLWIRSAFAQVVEWHGMARMSQRTRDLYLKHKSSSLSLPCHPVRAEGVGLEPTSPCGQRFSRPSRTLPLDYEPTHSRLEPPLSGGSDHV